MQLIFNSKATPKEYHLAGNNFPFPSPSTCLHPDCRVPIPPRPNGFYSRNIISLTFNDRILIRRYCCKYCGHTFSYLPSFCLPHFQYALEMIFFGLLYQIFKLLPFLYTLASGLHWQRQHLQFYRRRFMTNLKRIGLVLRNLIPGVKLPNEDDKISGAKKVLSIVKTEFVTIQAFSTRFFAQCNRSFMAPCKLV